MCVAIPTSWNGTLACICVYEVGYFQGLLQIDYRYSLAPVSAHM
jgi:hypothetical protein